MIRLLNATAMTTHRVLSRGELFKLLRYRLFIIYLSATLAAL